MSYNTATVSDASGLQQALTDAGSASAGNTIITIENDITITSAWTSVYIDGYNGADVVVIEGNKHTIKGLTAPLFKGGFAGDSGIVIKDLTIADSVITGSQNSYATTTTGSVLGSGAFIESIDSMDIITLKNCHLKDSTVTGSRTGGLIGWNSGYNNVNDGPVKTYVNITDCSVVNCTITGDGTVGGIVGHAGANPWTWNTIENCIVKDCTLISNDDSYRVGAIVGTANTGTVTITNCVSENNTITQNNKDMVITRPTGQSELYGRFVPDNGSGSLTIDGVAI